MNFEIEESDYSASIDVDQNGVHVNYVFVTVAGVTFDIKDFLPSQAWDALFKVVKAKYEAAGGDAEEQFAKSQNRKEMGYESDIEPSSRVRP